MLLLITCTFAERSIRPTSLLWSVNKLVAMDNKEE